MPRGQNKTLTKKEELFAVEVVNNCGKKVKAYEHAGYSMNMSIQVIGCQAEKVFNRPHVAIRVQELQHKKNEIANKKFCIDAEYVLRRCHEIDQLDILDIIEDDLTAFRPLNEWPKSWRISISAIDMRRIIIHQKKGDTTIETLIASVKWPDKIKNLKLIGQHVSVKAFDKDSVEVNNITNNVQNNTFELENLDSGDLDTFKQILLKQAEKEDAIEGEFTQVPTKD